MPAKSEVFPQAESVKNDKWTPVRRGTVYCSPRCGGECTYEAYLRATRQADALAQRMGDGWSPRVWENLGWHHSIEKGVAAIYENKSSFTDNRTYTAFINTSPQFVVTAEMPEDALGFAIQDARTLQKRIDHDLNDISA